MADNPKKKKADSRRVSQQPHEQAFQQHKKTVEKSGSKNKAPTKAASNVEK